MRNKRPLAVGSWQLAVKGPRRDSSRLLAAHCRPSAARSRPGFTLTELLVVLLIISVLAGMILGGVTVARRSASKTRTKAAIQLLGSAIAQYESEWGDYPPGNGEAAGAEDLYLSLTSPFNPRSFINGGEPPTGDPDNTGHKVFVDAWRHPIRYTHHRHYSGEPRADDYRLESAGPDGRYGTDDDITNWKK